MSQLLKQPVIREALDLLDITDPESHDIYMHLLTIFNRNDEYLLKTDSVDQTGLWVFSVNTHYIYDIGDGNRRVVFNITGQHDISQIFLFLIFMECRLIEHRSRLSVDKGTSKELIKIASKYVEENRPRV